MRAGGLTDQAGVHHARGRVAELELPAGTRFNVDGELCELRPARVESRGERVEVVVGDEMIDAEPAWGSGSWS
jgi:diacylglycerol kinase family enzyme